MNVKHIILTCLFSLCLTLLLAPPVRAAEVVETGTCGETANWFLYDDGTMVIRGTGEIGTSERLERASKEDVKKVVVEGGITSIAAWTFYGCSASEVILPYSLTNIGSAAFGESKITELSMPDSVVSVGGSAFANCDDLEKVRLSQNLKIMSGAMFKGSDSIRELIIPDSVEEIWGSALEIRFLEKLVIGRGVKSIGMSDINAATLREIQNHSTLDFSLRVFAIETDLITWKVDGVRTDVVGAGKTAFGKGKKYKIVYKYMNGVTCQGKRPKTYEYGIPATMPTAKRKGYVFSGWNWNEKRFAKSTSWVVSLNYVPNGGDYDTGAIVVMPRFIKVSVKKKSKDRITITADASGARCILDGISVRYSTDPTMKNCKIKWKYFSGKPKGYKEKFTIKAKKGKTYYIQFALYDDFYVTDENDINDWCWSKSKVYKMR